MMILALTCCCLYIAYLWYSAYRHACQEEERQRLLTEIVEAECVLHKALHEDPDNLIEHKRLRAKWLQLQADYRERF